MSLYHCHVYMCYMYVHSVFVSPGLCGVMLPAWLIMCVDGVSKEMSNLPIISLLNKNSPSIQPYVHTHSYIHAYIHTYILCTKTAYVVEIKSWLNKNFIIFKVMSQLEKQWWIMLLLLWWELLVWWSCRTEISMPHCNTLVLISVGSWCRECTTGRGSILVFEWTALSKGDWVGGCVSFGLAIIFTSFHSKETESGIANRPGNSSPVVSERAVFLLLLR